MSKIYIIAEIGINHNGDINLAKQLIDKADESGCNAVKFQKRTVDVVYSEEELGTSRQSPFGTTTREQKYGIELEIGELKELESYSRDKGLDFIVSCWDWNGLDEIEAKNQASAENKLEAKIQQFIKNNNLEGIAMDLNATLEIDSNVELNS